MVGAGAWGTALAAAAAQAGRKVVLWAREQAVVAALNTTHENARYLPGVVLPEGIAATHAIEDAAACEAVLVVVPAQHLREWLPRLPARTKPLVLCAKGIERGTGKLLTEVLSEAAPDCAPAILSGPSFARDVARGLPTAVTIAASQMEIALRLQATLGHATFRPYASDDLAGVALGGAAKNVYAIACGIVDGMGLGESARAALIARSFAELTRLGAAIGARPDTLMGLSGLGDLVLTATSPTSRNFSYGRALGQGREASHALAEGVATAPALVKRAHAEKVELPVAEAVAAVLGGSLPLGEAVLRLMTRPLKPE
ncbi:MAG TPA: NAD(P)H-dependent glycerol-3-phosphate dehydrogenase [Rhizomicrobium sp.]|nr:NAD(P)H-dependent glycerol-3-phosphate dehydrogenase [Rhizomicrobium sp.]